MLLACLRRAGAMHTGSGDGLPLRAGLRPSEAALDMAARHQTCKAPGGRPGKRFGERGGSPGELKKEPFLFYGLQDMLPASNFVCEFGEGVRLTSPLLGASGACNACLHTPHCAAGCRALSSCRRRASRSARSLVPCGHAAQYGPEHSAQPRFPTRREPRLPEPLLRPRAPHARR
jgi:hypothetical protein